MEADWLYYATKATNVPHFSNDDMTLQEFYSDHAWIIIRFTLFCPDHFGGIMSDLDCFQHFIINQLFILDFKTLYTSDLWLMYLARWHHA